MSKITIRDFFEELQKTTGVSILDIISKKDTNLTRMATCYSVAYICEVGGLDFDTAGVFLGIKEDECVSIFNAHDSKYYDSEPYRKTYDKILSRISSYGVCLKPEPINIPNVVVQKNIFSLPDFLI